MLGVPSLRRRVLHPQGRLAWSSEQVGSFLPSSVLGVESHIQTHRPPSLERGFHFP